MKRRIAFFVMCLALFSLTVDAARPVRVACVGNSVTYGYGVQDREHNCYPARLQQLLGKGYEVGNFGKSGATLIARAYRPYFDQSEYRQALAFKADLVVIHLGLNDTDPRSWPNYRDDFVKDYRRLIDSFREVNPQCRIWICRMTPIASRHPRFKSGTRDWYDQIQAKIEQVARTTGVQLINLQQTLYNRPDLLPDALHPNVEGAGLLARAVYGAITGDMGGLQLPAIYGDGMVLQRNAPIHLEGTADAGARVEVKLGRVDILTQAAPDGHWALALPPMEAARNLTLQVQSKKQKRVFKDVAVGEVWLCSGQSNMAFRTSQMVPEERATLLTYARKHPDVRLLNMTERWATNNVEWALSALDSVNRLLYYQSEGWQYCDERSADRFSAIGLSFARMLADSLGVVVGVVHNAVGGSPAESWISRSTLEHCFPDILVTPAANDFIQPWVRERMSKNIARRTNALQRHPYEPCYLFEAGIEPLARYTLKGVLWYQGESNAHNMEAYKQLFGLQVESWRAYWGWQIPFYFVQLSSLNRPSWPWFRDVQRQLARELPACEMVVSSDMGDSTDVHPRHKLAIGERLARWALNKEYGRKLVPSGPLFRSVSFRDGAAYVTFDYAEGLKTADGQPLRTFEVAGGDGIYVPAQAEVTGAQVKVWSREVSQPVNVRYGWLPFTRANLVNGAALPASTFSSEP